MTHLWPISAPEALELPCVVALADGQIVTLLNVGTTTCWVRYIDGALAQVPLDDLRWDLNRADHQANAAQWFTLNKARWGALCKAHQEAWDAYRSLPVHETDTTAIAYADIHEVWMLLVAMASGHIQEVGVARTTLEAAEKVMS